MGDEEKSWLAAAVIGVPSILCDAVHSVAVHNGIARLVLVRLDAAGASVPVLEVAIPVSQVGSLLKALAPIGRGA